MEMITLLAAPAEMEAGEVTVEGDAYRHLFRARRVPVGAIFRVVDGRGRARWGKVARVDRSSAKVTLGEPAPTHEPAWRLDLLVPTFRPERASWLVEKATELGVSAIRFLNSSRAPRHFGEANIERFGRLAAAAVEQCHRSLLPEITGPHDWREIGPLTSGIESRWFLDTRGVPGDWGDGDQFGARGALLVGPEGGWTPEERQEVLDAGWRPVGLGPRILRIESAALAGAAMLLLGRHS
ncbi:MAG TPA: RsmE family RNA methyltransferase [Thermoanaerobaculia bacterium]|jgi:16S rRNA (uracil1498-N3)-methyltransferase|nr:RsmE family RNA methyltransferase [Thermoanaerobaculia bacterium]